MRTKLFCPILAAAVAVAAMLGSADRADAAIRITITDGTTTKVFYSDTNFAQFSTTLDGLEVVSETSATNFPGTSIEGELTQSLTLFDSANNGALLDFTFTAAVIDPVLGFGFVDGVTYWVTDPAQLTAVNNSDLALFTAPTDSSLVVTSEVSVQNGPHDAGTVQNTTTVNTVPVPTNVVPLDDTLGTGTAIVGNGSGGYTLSSQVVLLDAPAGISNMLISANSSVTGLTPEPASLAVWGLGAMALVLGAGARRFRKTKV